MKIVINDFFARGSHYKSETQKKGVYCRVNNRQIEDVVLTRDQDFDLRLPRFSSLSSPIVQYRNRIMVLFPIKVETGTWKNASIVGTASQALNVAGTLEVQTEPGENTEELVNLSMIGGIKGNVKTKAQPKLSPPLAKLSIKISVDQLGEDSEIVMAHGTQSLSAGRSGETGLELNAGLLPGVSPNMKVGLSTGTQVEVTSDGELYIPVNRSAWVPVNTPLVWRLTVDMLAKNDRNATALTTAEACLNKAFLTFDLFPGVRKKDGPGYSPMLVAFIDDLLKIFDASAPLGKRYGEPWTEEDFQGLKQLLSDPNYGPRLRQIVRAGQFSQEDALLNAVLSFPELRIRERDDSAGKFFFNDAELRFLEPGTLEVLGQALLTDIRADAKWNMITGNLMNLRFNDRLVSGSDYARSLLESNGAFEIDPDIITVSRSFTTNAVTGVPFVGKLTAGEQESNRVLLARAGAHERPEDLELSY